MRASTLLGRLRSIVEALVALGRALDDEEVRQAGASSIGSSVTGCSGLVMTPIPGTGARVARRNAGTGFVQIAGVPRPAAFIWDMKPYG